MFFPIKCQGENIIVVYGKLRQKELQYICIVNSLILLDLINTMVPTAGMSYSFLGYTLSLRYTQI